MGARSSTRRSRATEQLWRERSRRVFAVLAVIALALPLATVTGLVALGATLGPRGASAGAASAEASPRSTADLSARPAQAVVASLLSSPPVGWVRAGTVILSASDPLAEGCDATLPSGVTSASRRFDVRGQRIAVTVTAYGAGAGPIAVRDRLAALSTCPGVTTGPSSTLSGVDAFVAWRPASTLPAVSALGWRRGDVVVALYAAGTGARGLAELARSLDTALLRAFDGRCADVSSTLADAARSPYVEGVDFTGLLVPVPVTVTPLPTPEAGTPIAAPSPAPSLSYPVRPTDPVWPSELPSPVGAPSLPADPGAEPTSTGIASRAADLVGPGCGWAFTGLVAPSFDDTAESARFLGLVRQAREQLLARQEQWRLAVEAYRTEASTYDEQLLAFLQYAEQVRVVADAWDSITAARDGYQRDLAAYEAAVLAAQQFEIDREAARAAYDAAVQACDAVVPSPTPTESAAPSGSPSATDTPTASLTSPAPSVVNCPPDVPPILFEQPPLVPPVPTPPPDPTPPAP